LKEQPLYFFRLEGSGLNYLNARIEKRGGDVFLGKIDTLKVRYVTTSLKMHAVKSYKQVHPKQNTRNTPGYIRKVDGRDPHGTR